MNRRQMLRENVLRNEKGFTLIEIIAVLIILGILAAVAVPRYIDMQEDARNQAIQGAFAAGSSQLAMQFASDLLGGANNASGNWAYSATMMLGDFNATLNGNCGPDKAIVTINATGSPDWVGDVTGLAKSFTICGS